MFLSGFQGNKNAFFHVRITLCGEERPFRKVLSTSDSGVGVVVLCHMEVFLNDKEHALEADNETAAMFDAARLFTEKSSAAQTLTKRLYEADDKKLLDVAFLLFRKARKLKLMLNKLAQSEASFKAEQPDVSVFTLAGKNFGTFHNFKPRSLYI